MKVFFDLNKNKCTMHMGGKLSELLNAEYSSPALVSVTIQHLLIFLSIWVFDLSVYLGVRSFCLSGGSIFLSVWVFDLSVYLGVRSFCLSGCSIFLSVWGFKLVLLLASLIS